MLVRYKGKERIWLDKEVYDFLKENGIDESNGCSEAYPDGWVFYQGDDGFEIWVQKGNDNMIKYWSNAIGEIFETAPYHMAYVYEDMYEEGLCNFATYLGEYDGIPGIVLETRYDDDFVKTFNITIEKCEEFADRLYSKISQYVEESKKPLIRCCKTEMFKHPCTLPDLWIEIRLFIPHACKSIKKEIGKVFESFEAEVDAEVVNPIDKNITEIYESFWLVSYADCNMTARKFETFNQAYEMMMKEYHRCIDVGDIDDIEITENSINVINERCGNYIWMILED